MLERTLQTNTTYALSHLRKIEIFMFTIAMPVICRPLVIKTKNVSIFERSEIRR